MKRAPACALCTLLICAVLTGLFYLAVSRVVYEAGEFARHLPELLAGLSGLLARLGEKIASLIAAAPAELRPFLNETLDSLLSFGPTVPAGLYAKLAALLSGIFASLPSILLFASTYALGTYFICRETGRPVGALSRLFPRELVPNLAEIKRRLAATFLKWLRVQSMLAGMTFFLAAVGLAAVGEEYFLLLGLFVALADALPVVGPGAILVPLGAASILSGAPARGAAIIILYIIISFARSMVEPRLIGEHIGLHPLLALICMYAGFKLFGVWGMLLFPVVAVILKQLRIAEYLKESA